MHVAINFGDATNTCSAIDCCWPFQDELPLSHLKLARGKSLGKLEEEGHAGMETNRIFC